MDKTELKIVLSSLEGLKEREPGLEQYPTPPDIAADVLNRVELDEEMEGKRVVDLGCGNGVFAIGSAFLGAEAVGVDRDPEAVETADSNLEKVEEETGEELDARFEEADVRGFSGEGDVVVMNPPFGIQKEGENLVFLGRAFQTAPLIYSLLHRPEEEGKREETRKFIEDYASDRGFTVEVLGVYDFPLPRSFEFHEEERKNIKVDLYRFEQG